MSAVRSNRLRTKTAKPPEKADTRIRINGATRKNSVVISTTGGSITLDNVTMSSLTGADFIFTPPAGDFMGSGNADLFWQNKINGLFPVTGRVGYLVTPQFLVYGKVGFAWFNDRNSYFAGGVLVESTKWTDPMITAGLGFEYMFAPHWSVFVEGNYYWAEANDAAHDYVSPAGVPLETINSRPRIATGLVGVNYKFNWDNGPVVAKY